MQRGNVGRLRSADQRGEIPQLLPTHSNVHNAKHRFDRIIPMPDRLIAVFDLGGVLIDWNPRHLYRKLFHGDAAMEHSWRPSAPSPGTPSKMPDERSPKPAPPSSSSTPPRRLDRCLVPASARNGDGAHPRHRRHPRASYALAGFLSTLSVTGPPKLSLYP